MRIVFEQRGLAVEWRKGIIFNALFLAYCAHLSADIPFRGWPEKKLFGEYYCLFNIQCTRSFWILHWGVLLDTLLQTRITSTLMAVKMLNMKVIHCSILNHIFFNHFPKRTCWKKLFNLLISTLFLTFVVCFDWRRTCQNIKSLKLKVE